MRLNFLTLALSLTIATANCQVTLSVQAGGNLTTAHFVQRNDFGEYKTKAAWQAGLNVRYATASERWFVFSGLALEKKSIFHQFSGSKNQYASYQPFFLTLPVGIGYSYQYSKNWGLNFYTGLYGSMGLGGQYAMRLATTISRPDLCDLVACPENIDEINRHISFGSSNANGNDFTRANWGAQVGLGLSAWRQFELVCMYNVGLSNILPPDEPSEKLYLRLISVDVKMNIKTFKQPNKNK